MKNKKPVAILLAVLLTLTALPLTAFATGTKYDVTVNNGENVILTGGTVGADAATGGENYSLNIKTSDASKLLYGLYITIGGYGSYNYCFDFDSGDLVIPGEEITGDIMIQPYMAKKPELLLDSATKIEVPYSSSFKFSDDDKNIYDPYNNSDYITRLYTIELNAGDLLDVELFGKDNVSADSRIVICRVNNGALIPMRDHDSDSWPDTESDSDVYGEKMDITIWIPGTYCIFAQCYDSCFDDEYQLNVNVTQGVLPFPDGDPNVTDTLDFTDKDNLPSVSASDLWSWDAATKTLTLKDGFYLEAYEADDEGIVLPAGASVVVEGNACIISDEDAIYFKAVSGNSNSEIRLMPGAALEIFTLDCCGIYADETNLTVIGESDTYGNLPLLDMKVGNRGIYVCYGDITLKNCNFKIDSVDCGIEIDFGNLTVENCSGDIVSEDDEGIYIDDSDADTQTEEKEIKIENSRLTIVADDEGIQSYAGGITITDSDINIYSEGEEGIDIVNDGDITVSGGRLVIVADENTLETSDGKIVLEDVNFYLETMRDYWIIRTSYSGGFSLPGTFRMMNSTGGELYNGEWDDSLLSETNNPYYIKDIDDASPCIIYSVLEAGKADDASVKNLKSEYTVGEKAHFTAIPGAPRYFVHESTGYIPTVWEVEGQNISGTWSEEPYDASFSTDSLPIGTYTLKVTFTNSFYFVNEGWRPFEKENPDGAIARAGNPTGNNTVVKTYTFKVVEKTDSKDGTDMSDGVNNGNGGAGAGNKETSPQTGDSSFSIYVVLIVLSIGFSIIYYRRKVYR